MKRRVIASILIIALLMIQLMPIQYATSTENSEQDQATQDDTTQDDTSQDDTAQDDTTQDDTTQDDTTQDDTTQDDTTQDDTTQDDTTQDDATQDDTTQDDTTQDDATQDDTTQDDTTQDDTTQDDTTQDNITQDDEIEKDIKTQLTIVQKASEKKYLENDQGYISKEITDIDAEKGEVTVNLSLSNMPANKTEEKERCDDTEVFIIVSENIANDAEELSKYTTYINTLATKIFDKSSNTKIGIVGMKGPIDDTTIDENGNLVDGPNDESEVPGTADNAEIVVNLTKNAQDIKTGLQNMNTSKTSYRNNLQATVRLAKNSYSDNVNKILISLYDNVPSTAIGVSSQADGYGGWFSKYETAEESIIAHTNSIVSKTKSEILSLQDKNIEFILLRPDDTSFNQKWYKTSTGEFILDFDGSPYVQDLYGTLENATYGKMYSLNNDNLEKVVTEYIYEDIMENIRVDIKSAVIKEYFSKDILDNFTITFADENIDTTNLKRDGYIVWNIGDVEGNKVASLQYTLKIKNMKNVKLLEKVISTSEKTELTYINYLDQETTVVSTSSPKIKLTEDEYSSSSEYDYTEEDPTVAPGKIAQAGISDIIKFVIFAVILIGTIGFVKYKKLKDI